MRAAADRRQRRCYLFAYAAPISPTPAPRIFFSAFFTPTFRFSPVYFSFYAAVLFFSAIRLCAAALSLLLLRRFDILILISSRRFRRRHFDIALISLPFTFHCRRYFRHEMLYISAFIYEISHD